MPCLLAYGLIQTFCRAKYTNAPAISLLSVYLTQIYKGTWVRLFTEVLSVQVGREKLVQCPLLGNRYITGGRCKLWDPLQE